jgi:hypothetical protein
MFGLAVAAVALTTLDDLIVGPEAQADARTIMDRMHRVNARRRGSTAHRGRPSLDIQLIAAPITVDGELIAPLGCISTSPSESVSGA